MSFAFVILCAVLVTVLTVCLPSKSGAVEFVCVLVTLLDSKVYAAVFGYVVCPMLVSSLPARFWLWIAGGVLVPLKNRIYTRVVSLAGSFVANAMLLLSEFKSNTVPPDEPGDSQTQGDSEVQSSAGLGQDDAPISTHQGQGDPEPPFEYAILRKRKPFRMLDEAFHRRVEAAKERERQKGPVVLAPDTEATRERDRRLWVQVCASRMAMAMATPRNEDQAAEAKASDEEIVELPQSHTALPMTPETISTKITPAALYATPMTPEMTPHKARFPGAFSISSGSDSGDELQTPSGSEYGADGSENIEEYNEEYDEDVEEYEEDEGEEPEGEEGQFGEVGGQIGSEEGNGEGSDEDGKSDVEVGAGEDVEDEDGTEGGEHVEIGGELDENEERNPGTLLIGNSAHVPVGTPAFVNTPTIVTDASRSIEGAQVSEREGVEARPVGVEETTSNEQVVMNGTSVVRRTDGGEITNDGNGEAEANNRALDSQVNYSVQVSDEVEEQASSVDSTGSPILGPAGPTIVVDAPPVMGDAQTVEQGQAYAGVEETTVNELATVNDTSATSGLTTETVHLDLSGPIDESFGATPASALEHNEEPVADNLTGAHDPTTLGGFQTGSSAGSDAASLSTSGNAKEPGLQIQLPLVASPPVPTMTKFQVSNVTPNTIGPVEAQHSTPHSDPLHVANSSFAAGFNAGFQAAIEQAAQYLASQAHGAEATGGYTHQQRAGAIEGNAGHGGPWIWNETQSTPALGEAQVSAHGEVVDGLVAEGQVEGSVGTFVQGQQPEMVAEQAMGPGVSPPSPSLAPSAAGPQASVSIGLPILVPGLTADAPIHLPVIESSPNAAGIPVPSPTPTRSSLPVRRSRTSASRKQKRQPYPAVRRPLPRKPRKQSLEPGPVNTSHITYYGYKGWRLVGLNKALRACFPQWKATGFLPQYRVPDVPTMWIPTVAYDVEAPTVQEPEVTPGAETTVTAEPAQNVEDSTFPKESWRVGQPPVAWPRRSSRTSVFHESEQKGPLHQGQRAHLLRRRKKCRAPDPTPNTSHITYYGYKIWRLVARKKSCRACFPHWEATGFVPQYLVPDVPTLWSPPPADPIARDMDALALGMQQAAIAEPANAQGSSVASTVDVPTQGEASEPTATQSTGQAVDELADMFAGVMQNVQNVANGEVTEPRQVEAASAEGHVAEEVEAVAADSDEEDAAEVEAEVQIELGEEDMVAAEAYLNGLGLFGSGGNDA